MQLLVVCLAAFAHTVVALPHLSGPDHGIRLPMHVASNATNVTSIGAHHHNHQNGTTASFPNPGSPMSKPPSHDTKMDDEMQCRDLCALAVEMCVVAVPEDKLFW